MMRVLKLYLALNTFIELLVLEAEEILLRM